MTVFGRLRGFLGTLCLASGVVLGGLGYLLFRSDPQALLLVGTFALLVVLLGVFVDTL